MYWQLQPLTLLRLQINLSTEPVLHLSQQSVEDIKTKKTIEDARRDIAKQGQEQLERNAKKQAEDEAETQADDVTGAKALQEARRDMARQGQEHRANKQTEARDVSKAAAVASCRPLSASRVTSPSKVLDTSLSKTLPATLQLFT